ncbi:hypothetical protein JMUB3933_1890 [Leptotrichia wadei]|uniref:Uncharacterized protein n=2 Tax=Leptotrichia wadei TaxID=157687 RepID=A0A510K9W4_9FUSO|nr:hypothetical protein JMUB3933_1890 [Leptotrichia wadei]
MLFIKLNDTFSLALKLMSNAEAVAFTNFLFDYFYRMILICGKRFTNYTGNRKIGSGCIGC